MIYLPIFGKDSEPHSSSRLLGICSTFVFWGLLFLITFIAFPSKEKKVKYETIKIQLAPKEVPIIEEEIIQEIDLSKNFFQTNNQLSPSIPSLEEMIQNAPDLSKPFSTKEVDLPKQAQTQNQVQNNIQNINQNSNQNQNHNIEQNKPKHNRVEDSQSKIKVKDEAKQNNVQKKQDVQNIQKQSSLENKQVSQKTEDKTETKNENLEVNTNASTNINQNQNAYNQTQLQMSDGSSRTIIEPSVIAINFSKEASQTITENHEIQIRFTVNENGYVVGTISISLESLLSQKVRDEIRQQISKWRFEPSNNISLAVFTLKMIKK